MPSRSRAAAPARSSGCRGTTCCRWRSPARPRFARRRASPTPRSRGVLVAGTGRRAGKEQAMRYGTAGICRLNDWRRGEREVEGPQPPGDPILRRPGAADRHARLGVLPGAVGVVRVHHARRARGAGDEHHRGARGDQDAGRRGAPADRAPAVPGGGVGDRPGRHGRRRPGLAGVPGPDLPARVGEGLLVEGDLPRGQARPAVACGRS